ncbi:tetratricopeptide repeat protein [Microcoleus sp. EPA2]|uniref:tetratricopeptide repeat protein n=1 Tax=Microcoleus sp. EPA2 TaxID=2841654 RepID=UPI00312B98C7
MVENKRVQLNPRFPMPTIAILPSRLIVTSIVNSMDFLGLTNLADKLLSDCTSDSRKSEILNAKTKKFYLHGLKNLEDGDLHGAVKNFSCAIEINPDFAPAYNDRGITRYKLGYKLLALEDLTTAIDINPERDKYYNNRGFILSRLEDYPAAIADYSLAVLLNPYASKSYFRRGTIYLKIDDYVAAMADFDSAIRITPDFGKAYFNRGIAKYNLKDIPGGFEDFQKSAELFKAQDKIEDYHEAVAKITELWY